MGGEQAVPGATLLQHLQYCRAPRRAARLAHAPLLPAATPAGGEPGGGSVAPHTPRLSMAAPENLPFELRVLEVALDTVAR